MAFEILKPEQQKKVRGLLFDMDGVVLDSEILYSRFWKEALLELGYSMTDEQALGMRSLGRELGQQYLEAYFGPGISYQEARDIRIRRMDAWVEAHGVEPKPGIYRLLDYLEAEHIPCAIATSSPLERIRAHLIPLGLYDRFDAVCSGYEVPRGKPEPDIYLYGASKLCLPAESCIALEDSPAGIESAKRAGCLPIIIPDQDSPSEKTLSMSFARADSLEDVIDILEILNK